MIPSQTSARAFVPMLHVASVPRAAAFYAAFDFAMGNSHYEPGCGEDPVWAWLESPGGATLMLVQADAPVDGSVQGVVFYLYCEDVEAMHARARAAGLDPGPIHRPFYMPRGEFRVRDPDGYVVMVAHDDD